MEHLEFVHFVDEDLCPEGLPKDAFKEVQRPDFGQFPWEEWKTIIATRSAIVGATTIMQEE
jgi:hypothetical protein